MQKLTVLTFGALALGICGFFYDTASAQNPTCSARHAAIYFNKDSATLSEGSEFVVARMAEEAKACGKAARLVAVAPRGQLASDRADALADLFNRAGVEASVAKPQELAAHNTGVAGRAASLRLIVNDDQAGLS